jgi:leucine-rich repeat protein SHOC2
MAPAKRQKTSTSSPTASGYATADARDPQPPRADRGSSAPDADLVVEPEVLMCPITGIMFRDPVMVFESGHTYERSAVLSHFERDGAKDPLTGRALSSMMVTTNRTVRQMVRDWLDRHPDVTPDRWDSRELLEPSEDVGVLRTWRAMCSPLQEMWPVNEQPEHWKGVTMENGSVVELVLDEFDLTGAMPAEIGQLIGQLTSLVKLNLSHNQLTSVPAEIGQLTSLQVLGLSDNQLTSVPAEIGQLTSLTELKLYNNKLTNVPAEIGQLTSLTELCLGDNKLTSVPAEIRQLTSLVKLNLSHNQLESLPAEIGLLTSLKVLNLNHNQLWSVPAEFGLLTSLKVLNLNHNQLESLPAEIGQLTSLERLNLYSNQFEEVPAAIRRLEAAGCFVIPW